MAGRRLIPLRLVLPSAVSLLAISVVHATLPVLGALVLDVVLTSSSFLVFGLLHRVLGEGSAPLGRDVRRTYGLGSLGYLQDICLAGYFVTEADDSERSESEEE